jgi:hypothetical protein
LRENKFSDDNLSKRLKGIFLFLGYLMDDLLNKVYYLLNYLYYL